jgi:hypothetical protein
VPLDRLVKEIRDPSTEWDDALRYYFNIRTAGRGRLVDPRRWVAIAKPNAMPPRGTYIGAGFDGSVSEDETWLVGSTVEGYCFRIGRWNRPADVPNWTVPRLEVMAKVEWMFSYFKVGRFNYDPPKWRTEGETWEAKWTDDVVVAFDTNVPSRQAPAVDRLLVAIREGSISHDGDPDLADHMAAAHLKRVRLNSPDDDGRTRYMIDKGEDRRKIDGAMALLLAHEAAMAMPPEPPPRPELFVGVA